MIAPSEREEFQMTISSSVRIFLLGAGLALGTAVHAADEPSKSPPDAPAATETKPEQHIMMDHSPADTKSMRMMKDKKVKIHTAGDPPAPDTTKPGEEHIMMDHSKGDIKSMSMMKDKTVPIHKHGEPVAMSKKKCVEHVMMDHSRGDPKSMGMMKDKTVPIHKSGDCVPTPEAAAPAPKP